MKNKKLIIMLLVVGAFSTMAFRHTFYVSICQIEHNEATQSLEISHRIFLDDFEKGLESLGTGSLKLGDENQAEKAKGFVLRYMMQHFKIAVDGKPVKWNFIGTEFENDVIWIHVEVSNVPAFKTIKVEDTVLTEVYDQQTNMVHVKVGELTKTLLLSASTKEGTLDFSE